MNILNTLKSIKDFLFKNSNYSTDLEEFVVSKNPTSIKDVEHWSKVFDEIHYK